MKDEEGRIEVDGHQVWYRRIGEGGVPLLLLHGGPGAGHDYLEPLAGLAERRAVIFYDQLGCGRSDQPDDPSLWRIERFVREVDTVRAELGLDRVHILGQSWGGWLAIEYMLSAPQGVEGLVLASTSASIPQFVDEATRLIGEMPEATGEAIRHHEAAGEFDHPDFVTAVETFYIRHVCRLDPWPDALLRSIKNLEADGGHRVYNTINGPTEFTVIGNLKDWDRIDRLAEITVPTLITVGRHDEITPACAETIHQGIANSRVVVFENSAHCAHLEETEAYLAAVGAFLADVEVSNG
jgi:proline-specific peptidase